jgi:hypothetical protein
MWVKHNARGSWISLCVSYVEGRQRKKRVSNRGNEQEHPQGRGSERRKAQDEPRNDAGIRTLMILRGSPPSAMFDDRKEDNRN